MTTRLKLQIIFFTEEILEKLLMHTNNELYKNNDTEHNATFKQLNITKLRAFIGFLYLMVNNMSTEE